MFYQSPKADAAPGVVPRARYQHVQHFLIHFQVLGLFAVAAIDASVIPVPVPGSTDLLLLWLIARGGNPWILVPGAVAGGIFGGYTTWHVGKSSGYATLQRYVPARFLHPVSRWMDHHPILSVFLPAVLPPPMTATPFLLASGALGVARRRFFLAFGLGRSARYALIAWVGASYERQVFDSWPRVLRKVQHL